MKWSGAVVSLLLLVAWVASGWLSVQWQVPSGKWVGVGKGLIGIGQGMKPPTPSAIRSGCNYRAAFAVGWWPELDLSATWQVIVPLWMPAALATAAAAAAWRLDILARRRDRIGRCPKCNYDRAGLAPGSVCPECGAATVAA